MKEFEQSALASAIDDLYATFANYRVDRVEGCPCCVSAEDIQRLHSRRLRDLTGEDLSRFAFKALSTWGTLADLKHFLPRILELISLGQIDTDLQSIVLRVVSEGRLPAGEQGALAAFVSAYLGAVVAAGGDGVDVIESAGLAGMDVAAMLGRAFLTGDGVAGVTGLARLVAARAQALVTGRPGWIWWKGDAGRVVEGWLLSGAAYARLMGAFEGAADHAEAGAWAAACDVLEAAGGVTG